MNKQELKFILQSGEGLKIEFKKSIGSLDKEIVAFANSNGGRIFLGVDDNGKVKGVNITNKLKSQIQDIARNCDPPINVRIKEFENILIIEVKEGKDKPHKCSSGFYLRQGANSQKMTRDEILDFAIGEGKIKFDEQIKNEFEFPEDFDENKLDNYLSLAKISKIISNEKIFAELNIIKKDKVLKFNNAGVLFFAKNPQKFISHSVFTCVSFKDKKGSDIIDRQEITGSLIEIIEEVMKFVVRNTRVAYKFTGKPQRENIYEYPLEAIREAVINSVTHRDYFEDGHNNLLKIFPDRISIVNV
jgi:ATP-dependent DNA helicase RecG